MTVFESSKKTINAPCKPVYSFLADIRNFESLIPDGKVRNFEAGSDNCTFTVDGIGEVGVRLAATRPYNWLVFESQGKVPFRFDLNVDLETDGNDKTLLSLKLSADLNMMMKMIASKPIEEGLEKVVNLLAVHLNDQDII